MPSSQHAFPIAPAFPQTPDTLILTSPPCQMFARTVSENETEDRAIFACAVCLQFGQEEYPNASDWVDRVGRKLRDARIAPNGQWVCSQPCRSQLMFQQASDREKASLRRYEIALCELRHSGEEVEGLLKTWDCYSDIKPFNLEIAQFMIGAMERRNPKKREVATWIEENEDPEETLRAAIVDAVRVLDNKATISLRSEIEFQHLMVQNSGKGSDPYPRRWSSALTTKHVAEVLGTLGTVITKLRVALGVEVID